MRTLKRYLPHGVFSCMILPGIILLGIFRVATAEEQVIDRVAAIVNEDVISLFDLNQFAAPQIEKLKSVGYPAEQERAMIEKLMKNLIEQLIDRKLADQESRRMGITVTEKEIDATIGRIRESYDYTDEELEESLVQQDTSLEEFREHWRERLLMSKLINREIKSKVVITEADIKAYYDAHSEQYEGEKKYHLRCIILKIPPDAERDEKEEIKKRMEMIMAELESGRPFDETAERFSESFASKGGDIGLFKPEKLSQEVRDAVGKLSRGEHTGILETDLGYQIYYLENIIFSQKKSLEEVSREIEETLYKDSIESRYRTWLENLRKQSYIRIVR